MKNQVDPKALFVISAISREGIAEELNGYRENTDFKIRPFTPDDTRLTDEICEA